MLKEIKISFIKEMDKQIVIYPKLRDLEIAAPEKKGRRKRSLLCLSFVDSDILNMCICHCEE